MKLVCPECGATGSAAMFTNDAEIREVLAAIVKLPAPVVGAILPYLSLFRPESRALSWKKARRLVVELAALVAANSVQIQGKPARPCAAYMWAEAMEAMVARRYRLQLPLKNHNYLKTVAWPIADAADADIERKRNEAEKTGSRLPDAGDENENVEHLSEEELAKLPEAARDFYQKRPGGK